MTLTDVADIARRLPGVGVSGDGRAFEMVIKGKRKGFAWTWNERVHPKKPRQPNLGVLAVRVGNLIEKDLLIESDPEKFFTEPHYNGYAAVLVRLEAIGPEELGELLERAYRTLRGGLDV